MEKLDELLREYAQSIRRDDGTAFVHADEIRRLVQDRAAAAPAGAKPDAVPKWVFDQMVVTLTPAWDYVQTHQEQFNARAGDDKTKIVVDEFLKHARAAASPAAEAVALNATMMFEAASRSGLRRTWGRLNATDVLDALEAYTLDVLKQLNVAAPQPAQADAIRADAERLLAKVKPGELLPPVPAQAVAPVDERWEQEILDAPTAKTLDEICDAALERIPTDAKLIERLENAAQAEALRKALFEARDAMRVMSNWVKKSDPAGHSWAVRMVDRANAVLNGGADTAPAEARLADAQAAMLTKVTNYGCALVAGRQDEADAVFDQIRETVCAPADAGEAREPVTYDDVVSACEAHGIPLPVEAIEETVALINHFSAPTAASVARLTDEQRSVIATLLEGDVLSTDEDAVLREILNGADR
ncbi:hypothetical protein WK07_04310 [Burkholderia multivorans]|uniref:hypothetical protein n=1 Tax=Burkholderia multivorans TaxID=87883 RepID=UPI00075A3A97|nr:hypothetical protein [Burkholderia multivorans]KVQ85526.1 hypothetical protein WK07_04310 [Burkholderia multivorans]